MHTPPSSKKINQLGLPSTTNTCICLVSGAVGGRQGECLQGAKSETGGGGATKSSLGISRRSFPPFYQRIFHKHIRDEAPTCMMFSPPTSPSIFPANCPGQSKRCTSKVSSQWRAFFLLYFKQASPSLPSHQMQCSGAQLYFPPWGKT